WTIPRLKDEDRIIVGLGRVGGRGRARRVRELNAQRSNVFRFVLGAGLPAEQGLHFWPELVRPYLVERLVVRQRLTGLQVRQKAIDLELQCPQAVHVAERQRKPIPREAAEPAGDLLSQ